MNDYDCTCLKRLMLAEHVWMLLELFRLSKQSFDTFGGLVTG